MIDLNDHFVIKKIDQDLLDKNLAAAKAAHTTLLEKSGAGAEFTGWVDLPEQISDADIDEILETVESIKSHSEYLVIVGIGGSYLGARAMIETLGGYFPAGPPKILFAGHHLDQEYHNELLKFLEDKDFSVNVISKSGTTTEPAIAFRLLFNLLEKKYGREGIQKRVIATTDKSKGALKGIADSCDLKTYVIPDDVGGRYSVFTPVGLLPIAAAGIDIRAMINGARRIANELKTEKDPLKNKACYYAALRNTLYQSGKNIEILVSYYAKLHYIKEWWKQLFGESEGKDGKGIFPAAVDFTSDLHSMGQFIQEGHPSFFETIIHVEPGDNDIIIPETSDDLDGLNYLAGTTMSHVNDQAENGTLIAHYLGDVPVIDLKLKEVSPQSIGELIYFFEFSCAISGYILGVNPFNQPGVESYKTNMFALLGKKGYEKQKQELDKYLDWL